MNPNVLPIPGSFFFTRNGSKVLIGTRKNHNLAYSVKIIEGGHGLDEFPGETVGETYWILEDGSIHEVKLFESILTDEEQIMFAGLLLDKEIV